jgi:putative membrane protein
MSLGFHFFPFFLLFALVGPALVVLVIVLAVVGGRRPVSVPPAATPPAGPPRETPLDILARRFASGEISADEYEKARELLREEKGPS